jgi:hypothetical protein
MYFDRTRFGRVAAGVVTVDAMVAAMVEGADDFGELGGSLDDFEELGDSSEGFSIPITRVMRLDLSGGVSAMMRMKMG